MTSQSEPKSSQSPISGNGGFVFDRRHSVSYREFIDNYVRPNKPVIMSDAINHWATLEKWTPNFFRTHYGSMDRSMNGLKMGEFIDVVEQSASSVVEDLPYLRNKSINQHFPELAADISPLPIYMEPNWFNNRLAPKRFSRNRTDLFIGRVGSRFPYLHFDIYHGYAFLFQIYGEKEYIMSSPEQTPFLYPKITSGKLVANVCSIDDIENPDLDRYPLFARAMPLRCVLKYGEMMFMPSGGGTRLR